MLAGELLARTAARFSNKCAIADANGEISYGALDAAANRFANALLADGCAKGDRIAIVSRNKIDYAIAHFGAARAGVILVNLSLRYTVDDIVYILNQTEARVFIYDEFVGEVATLAVNRLDRPVATIATGAGLADYVRGHASSAPAASVLPDDPLAMTYTGGTTGFPKGVLVSHASRTLFVDTVAEAFDFAADDVIAIATPLFHTAGIFSMYHPAVAVGATCVFLPPWNVETFLQVAARHRITTTLLVPTQVHDLMRHPACGPEQLRSFKRVIYAGAAMPPVLLDEALARLPWIEFIENYGQSEIGPVTVRRGSDLPAKARTVGRAIDGMELAILGPDGRVLAPGERGELASRGRHLFTCYYKEPEQTADVFRFGDGWAATGDVAWMDEDGFVTLVDRSKDIIVSGGENLYPTEIENALHAHQGVAACAVFAIPDRRLGEVPAAHVILKQGGRVAAAELIDFCADRLGRHKRPRLIKFVDDLPRTAVGKIQKNLLRQPYWQSADEGE